MPKNLKILGIETSCDETALALVEATNDKSSNPPARRVDFRVLKNVIASQIDVHKEYGGVVPGLAKREHTRNLIPTLYKVLGLDYKNPEQIKDNYSPPTTHYSLLERYPEMLEEFKEKVTPLKKPNIDLIAVTHGPGLEPALWVGVNFARALAVLWDIPLIGIDHMEGHIAINLLTNQQINSEQMTSDKKQITKRLSVSGLLERRIPCRRQAQRLGRKLSNVDTAREIAFPAISLAVSGGHTQLILVKNWLDYELLGETLDDAAGEAFDKVARLLGLPFPGGPHIEKLAKDGNSNAFDFPRPMLRTKDYNFSFSGLKTAVLYKIQKLTQTHGVRPRGATQVAGGGLTPGIKADLAASFQQAVIDTLVAKTLKAAKEYGAKTIMLAGGVAANQALKNQLGAKIGEKLTNTNYLVPEIKLATDNGVMIAVAGYLRYKAGEKSDWKTLEADSNKLITD